MNFGVEISRFLLYIIDMIKSETIKIKYTNDNSVIEQELKNMGIEPLRWAVIEVDENTLTLSVSY